jgi:hypothetical protein
MAVKRHAVSHRNWSKPIGALKVKYYEYSVCWSDEDHVAMRAQIVLYLYYTGYLYEIYV